MPKRGKCFQRASTVRPGDAAARYQVATLDLLDGHTEQARVELEKLTAEIPQFVEAHVSLATVILPAEAQRGWRQGARHRAPAECGKAGRRTGSERQVSGERLVGGALMVIVPLLAASAPAATDAVACASCHASETTHFRATPMAQALETSGRLQHPQRAIPN